MARHEFGGAWTTEKLNRVRKYLSAYTTIFTSNRNARFFRTIYVDAFAGTGTRVERPQPSGDLFEIETDPDREALKKGSARIALEVEPPFDRYLFIDNKSEHVSDLRRLATEFADRRPNVVIEQGESNEALGQWCRSTNWRKHRAVVFLDPYGMQVDWTTIKAIAETRAIDLWLLVPLGVALNRLLIREGPPPSEWSEALTRFFGTPDWRGAFYESRVAQTLFGSEGAERRRGTRDEVSSFFLDRLRSIFAKVADNPLHLPNSTGQPIYLLCFAAGNPKGAKTAVAIAQDILKPQ